MVKRRRGKKENIEKLERSAERHGAVSIIFIESHPRRPEEAEEECYFSYAWAGVDGVQADGIGFRLIDIHLI